MKLTHSEKDFISTVFSALNSPNQFCYLLNYVSKEILKSNDSFLEDEIYYYAQEQNKIKYYQQYKIKKKNGRFRQITAPTGKLKHLQSCLNIILQTIYLPHESAFGFIHNVSIVENAKQHTNREYVFNIDLKDFFASITADKITLFLQKPPFELKKQSPFNEILPQLIAAIASFKLSKDTPSALPQGSPLSPVLSNIVCQSFDDSLQNLAKRFNLTYSRYADDISFSGDVNIFSLKGGFYQYLQEITQQEGFLINTEKVRLQSKKWRQEVTGLVVNEKVNIRKKYVKELRMWLYLWETYGYEKASEIFHRNTPKKTSLYLMLNGKLNFLRMIKGDDNSTYLVLQKRLLSLWPTENLNEIKALFQVFIDSLPKKDMAVSVSQFLQSGFFDQTESFQAFFSKSETLKKYKAELIPYANGMNYEDNKVKDENSLSQRKDVNKVLFTDNLPFNYVGEWKQPVFTIERETGAIPMNGKDVENRDNELEKIDKALIELKQNRPNFYDILINKGSYFTAFSDENGKVWIKPISLTLYNSTEKIEEYIFEEGKLNEDKLNEVSDKYRISAFDSNKNGNLVKIGLFENRGTLTLKFGKLVGNGRVAYYLNNVSQEKLKAILNGEITEKPKLNNKTKESFEKKGIKLSDTLDYFNVGLVEHSAKVDRLNLLTNGKYYVTEINNPVSIFQNVGFRLKFKEQKENTSIEAITFPSIVAVTEDQPKEKSTYTLKEISDYVWNNMTTWDSTNKYRVYELKDDIDISELNHKFEKLKKVENEVNSNPKNREARRLRIKLKVEFLKTFTNQKFVKDYTKREEIPSQRAFLE